MSADPKGRSGVLSAKGGLNALPMIGQPKGKPVQGELKLSLYRYNPEAVGSSKAFIREQIETALRSEHQTAGLPISDTEKALFRILR